MRNGGAEPRIEPVGWRIPATDRRARGAELPGAVIPVGACRGFRFLRLTTLSVSPKNRPRAFSKHFEAQVAGGLFGPGVVEISQLLSVAKTQLARRL